jgi:hypothetical protein
LRHIVARKKDPNVGVIGLLGSLHAKVMSASVRQDHGSIGTLVRSAAAHKSTNAASTHIH